MSTNEHVKVLEEVREFFDKHGGAHEIAALDAAIAALKAEKPAADEVLIAIKRDEGYEDVHPELVAEDFVSNPSAWRYRVLTPAQESAND